MSSANRAVVEARAAKTVNTDTVEEALWRSLDYFPTPPWAARAIAHRLAQLDPGAATVSDPCCGEGLWTEPFREVFGVSQVSASDIYGFGYGRCADFRTDPSPAAADWVAFNPPFEHAAEMIERGLQVAARGVLALLRTSFLESDGRCIMLYEAEHHMTSFMPFVERVPMQLGLWNPDGSTQTCYSVFAFHKGRPLQPVQPFLTGTRAKYERLTDAARFAKPAPIPLLANLDPPPLFRAPSA